MPTSRSRLSLFPYKSKDFNREKREEEPLVRGELQRDTSLDSVLILGLKGFNREGRQGFAKVAEKRKIEIRTLPFAFET